MATQSTILIFGQLKDIVNSDAISLENINNTNELQQQLHLKYPRLANAKYVIAVDRKIITENSTLHINSEIALLPPFSGG